MAPGAQAWPPAERPGAATVEARLALLDAAATGDAEAVVAALSHPEDRVRASAVLALVRLGGVDDAVARQASSDRSARVRLAVAEVAATEAAVDLGALLADADPSVVEMACWAAGERGPAAQPLVATLATIARHHGESLCREAAVAALGAIGSADGLDAILAAMSDRATVRRRAVLALAPYDGPEVAAALERALGDRDWQVRQAAEDLT